MTKMTSTPTWLSRDGLRGNRIHADRTPSPVFKHALAGFVLLLCATGAKAQALVQAFQKPVWSTYIFVSTGMPRQNLVALARDSVNAKATLVLRGGFEPKAGGLEKLQKMVLDINAQCCSKVPATWVIDPKLFEQFQVKAAPTFVLTQARAFDAQMTATVSGDMELANALKYVAQNSKSPALRDRAVALYQSSFAHE